MTKELTGLELIKNTIFNSPVLQTILGVDLQKYGTEIVAEIGKTRGTDADLTICNPFSIVAAIKKACDLKLTIDGRQHCHLIKYGKDVNLQIGYRGFVYAIKRAYSDANIDVQLVYKGDEFKLIKEGDTTTYSLVRSNPFATEQDIVGGFCYISYTLGDRLVSFCETMSITEINKIKGCAKQDFIWKKWFEEKAKVAIIKRACKIHFSGINDEIQKISEFDNQEYDLEKEVTIDVDTIDSEKAFELQELIKAKGKNEQDICKLYKIDSIIQLPLAKYKTLKGALCK